MSAQEQAQHGKIMRDDPRDADSQPLATAGNNVPEAIKKHVWPSLRYGWVARVLLPNGAIQFYSCDTEAEAIAAVERGW